MNAGELIDLIGIKIRDPKFRHFTVGNISGRSYCLRQINNVLGEAMATYGLNYGRTWTQQLIDGQTVYEFPQDMLTLTHAYFEGKDGRNEIYDSILPDNEAVTQSDQYGIYRERVSSNEYELLPTPDAELMGTNVTIYRGDLPEAASKRDVWVDNEGMIRWSGTAYSSISTAHLEVYSRPDTTLVFTALDGGTQYIQVSIANGGPTGPASMIKTGLGTYAYPYLYAFTLYGDDNSNDSIIALLEGDESLEATGESATNGTIFEYGASWLVNDHAAYWNDYTIELRYRAQYPKLLNEEAELHPSLTEPFQDGEAIILMTAARLLRDIGRREDEIKIREYSDGAYTMLDNHKDRRRRSSIRRAHAR